MTTNALQNRSITVVAGQRDISVKIVPNGVEFVLHRPPILDRGGLVSFPTAANWPTRERIAGRESSADSRLAFLIYILVVSHR